MAMKSKATFQIEIPRRSAACTLGGEAFAPGMEYYSVLKEDPFSKNAYARMDYCLACWSQLPKGESYLSAWKSSVPQKKEASELPKKRDERALYLLKEALATDLPEAHAEAFVLSIYLARRRYIFLRQELQMENGKVSSLYEVAHTEEMIGVPKFSISELPLDVIQKKLATQLNPHEK